MTRLDDHFLLVFEKLAYRLSLSQYRYLLSVTGFTTGYFVLFAWQHLIGGLDLYGLASYE